MQTKVSILIFATEDQPAYRLLEAKEYRKNDLEILRLKKALEDLIDW
ncbi:MAG: hypothetical protein WA220_00440 [Candidatus Nitrosopolaris sp.]